MKSFLLQVLLFGLLFLCPLTLVCFCLKDDSAQINMLWVEKAKQERLRSVPGRRVVLIGGSNLPYGLDSTRVQREIGLPVVNLGLHAALGLEYHLRAALPGLHRGDVVVVCPEYMQFADDMAAGTSELTWLIVNVVPENACLLGWRQWITMARNIPSVGAKKAYRCWRQLKRKLKGRPPIQPGGTTGLWTRYAAACFNEMGDEVMHCEKDLPPTLSTEVPHGEKFSLQAVRDIVDFKHEAERLGAKVHLFPPAYHRDSFLNYKSLIDRITVELQRAGVGFESDPLGEALPTEYYDETAYHLNRRGVVLRTDRMITYLRRILAAEAKTPPGAD